MFDRVKYKKDAKKQLKGRWGIPILITAITIGIHLLLSVPTVLGEQVTLPSFHSSSGIGCFNYSYTILHTGSNFLPILTICVSAVLFIAQVHVYLLMSKTQNKLTFNNFLDGFTLWVRGILSTLWLTLWVCLWSLLFVIPGIVKAFSYSQIFFLVAEYPHLSIRKALRISKVITKGYKGDLFVMCLSFIGWHILATLSFGIGFLWLIPYQILSYTNAYHSILQAGLDSKVITMQDLEATS